MFPNQFKQDRAFQRKRSLQRERQKKFRLAKNDQKKKLSIGHKLRNKRNSKQDDNRGSMQDDAYYMDGHEDNTETIMNDCYQHQKLRQRSEEAKRLFLLALGGDTNDGSSTNTTSISVETSSNSRTTPILAFTSFSSRSKNQPVMLVEEDLNDQGTTRLTKVQFEMEKDEKDEDENDTFLMNDEMIEVLMDMSGKSKTECRKAYTTCGGDLEAAAEMLLTIYDGDACSADYSSEDCIGNDNFDEYDDYFSNDYDDEWNHSGDNADMYAEQYEANNTSFNTRGTSKRIKQRQKRSRNKRIAMHKSVLKSADMNMDDFNKKKSTRKKRPKISKAHRARIIRRCAIVDQAIADYQRNLYRRISNHIRFSHGYVERYAAQQYTQNHYRYNVGSSGGSGGSGYHQQWQPAPRAQTVESLMLELQYREITPEDYTLLMQLHERDNQRKMLETTEGLSGEQKMSENPDIQGEDACCCICMDTYEEEDIVRKLKCGHTFHKECIDQWLMRGSNSCPVDRVEITFDKEDKSDLKEEPDADQEK
jgi:NACalpha-BTF3-like transcription factor